MRSLAPPARRASLLLLALLVVASGCRREPAAPASAEAVLDAMEAAFEANTADVQTFTVSAVDLTAHYRRAEGDTAEAFVSRVVPTDAPTQLVPPGNPASFHIANVQRLVRGLRAGARLVGPDTLDGARVLVLEAEQPNALLGAESGSPGGALSAARVYVDAATHDVREIRLETVLDSSHVRPLVQRVRYSDFRTVDGFRLPFRARMIIEGLDQTIPEEERIVRRGNLALARSQAQQADPATRAEMIAEIDQLEQLLTTGIHETTFQVERVTVNEPVPDALFAQDPAQLFGAPPPGAPTPGPAPGAPAEAPAP